jgi:hypothetical protein
MATRKATLTAEEKYQIALNIHDNLQNGGQLWVTVPHTSASNMSYTIRARLLGAKGVADMWLNYWLAAELGATLDARDDLKCNGMGTDRALLVACDIANILTRHGFTGYDANTIKARWF